MNGDYARRAYSKLTQINRENVKKPAAGVGHGARRMQDVGQNGPETGQSAERHGFMYTTTAGARCTRSTARKSGKGDRLDRRSGVKHQGNAPRTRGIALWEDS